MSISDKDFLSLFGWDGFFESHYLSEPSLQSFIPARVINEERNLYRVQWGINKINNASVSGKFQFHTKARIDFPAVGDWVFIENPQDADRAIIHAVAPRKGVLQRRQVGPQSEAQILASNVDYAFIATSINDDLSVRRLERYLTVSWEANAVPVVLLTKADVCSPEEVSAILRGVQNRLPGVDVFSLAQDRFSESTFFEKYLRPGKTSVILGSSGVGKSTLVNFLLGREAAKTQSIRESDSKGRHTTTSRSLFQSLQGGLIIDTPGMRELSLGDHQEGLQTQFADIEALAEACRFSDCHHQSEPGCRVREALQNGGLLLERWESYLKLAAEVRHALRKQDRALAAEHRKAWKKLTEQGRAHALAKRRIK